MVTFTAQYCTAHSVKETSHMSTANEVNTHPLTRSAPAKMKNSVEVMTSAIALPRSDRRA